MIELRHLRYFAAVAEELHFGRAASHLRIAQPSLSRQIRDLEAEIGADLLLRDRRGVKLTAAGAELLERTRGILSRVSEAVDAVRRAGRGEIGTLKILYLPGMGSTQLPSAVREFRVRHEGVRIELREAWPETQREALLRGDADVGFGRDPLVESGIATEVVIDQELVVALPAGHRLASRRSLSLRMLAEEPMVLPDRSRGAGFHDQVIALCQRARFSPRVVQEAAYLELVVAVASGAGVAIVPESLRRAVRAGVVYRPLRERPRTQIVMMWPMANQSPVAQAFVTAVRRSFRSP